MGVARQLLPIVGRGFEPGCDLPIERSKQFEKSWTSEEVLEIGHGIGVEGGHYALPAIVSLA